MKIAHFTNDNIFFDNALTQFESCFPEQNFVFVLSNNTQLLKIKNNKNQTIVTSYNKIKTNNFDYLIFHSLSFENAKFLNRCKISKHKIIWLLHGYEVYGLPDFKKEELYETKTMEYFNLKNNLFEKLKNKIRPIANFFLSSYTKEIKKAMKRVDYFGVPYFEEYEFLSKKFNLTSKWLKFSYYPLNTMQNNLISNSNNIFIGNSASPTSNHLDVFEKLKEFAFNSNQKVISPLSYGDKNYANEIKKIGYSIFGDRFMPLTDFLSLKQYNKLLTSCSVSIMNHKRQQSFGTFLFMVYMGANVFLNENSTIFKFCQQNKIIVSNFKKDKIKALSKQEIAYNKKKIASLFNTKKMLNILKNELTKV